MHWEETPLERWERRQKALAKAEHRARNFSRDATTRAAPYLDTDNGTYQHNTERRRFIMVALVVFIIVCTAWFVAGPSWLIIPGFLAAVWLTYLITEWVQ